MKNNNIKILQLIQFITMLICLVYTKDEKEDTLISVQLTHRHGARFPINDLGGAEKYEKDYEELSNVGKRELFMLGRYLNKQYIQEGKFLSSVLKPREITIYSTDKNRTIDSTNSLFQGLYPQGNGYEIDKDQKIEALPPWNKKIEQLSDNKALPGGTTPIAVHALDRKYLVAFDSDYCTVMVDKIQENKESQAVQDVMKQVDKSLKKFCEYTGEEYPLKDFKTVYKYVDTWIAILHISPQDKDNEVLNKIVKDEEMWNDLLYCYAQYFQIIYFQNKHDNLITSTPFVEKLLDNFDVATNDELQDIHKKLVIYSAHDSTQAMVWRRFGLTNWECQKQIRDNEYKGKFCFDKFPIYSSQVIFELWERGTDQQHIIKIKVDGEEVPVEACNYKYGGCEYSKFKEFLLKDNVEDFEKECIPLESIIEESEDIDSDDIPGWFIAVLCCLSFVIISIVAKVFLMRKEYIQLVQQSEQY